MERAEINPWLILAIEKAQPYRSVAGRKDLRATSVDVTAN